MNVDINLLKPDPNQPRKYFSDERIKRLGVSLLHEGMINPIEVDEDYMIITGENRYRAAKAIGWKEVPVNINKSNYSAYDRIKHQMAENLHQSGSAMESMNPMDVAEAFQWLLKQKGWTPSLPGRLGERFKSNDHHVDGLAKNLGIDKDTIYEHLKLLSEPEFVRTAVKKGTPRTYFREIDLIKVPQEAKDALKKKVTDGIIKSRGEIERIRAIAKQDSDLAIQEIERSMGIIDPKTSTQTNRILNATIELGLSMEALAFADVHPKEKEIVRKQLYWVVEQVRKYLGE